MGLRSLLASATQGGVFQRRDYTRRRVYQDNYRELAAALCDTLEFTSHLDVGCGQGLLLGPMLERGKDIAGIEGSPAAREFTPAALRDKICTANITELVAAAEYDLVSCIEVLEHIPEGFADAAVGYLTRSARRWVYFSAAIPRQPGVGHINCQPSLYWMLAFARHGWQLDLAKSGQLHAKIRGMTPCWWLPQNALIFAPAP